MNIKTLAIAALLGISIPSVAFAQTAPDASSTTGADKPINPDDLKYKDFDVFLQGFGAADFTSTVNVLDTASDFSIVKLSTLANADASRLTGALAPRAKDIEGMRAQIAGNAAAMAVLEHDGLSAEDVVWIDTDLDGSVTLFVSDFDTM